MMKNNLAIQAVKSFLCGIIISCISVCPLSYVFAGSASSGPSTSKTYGGYSYKGYNTTYTGMLYGSKFARGGTTITSTDVLPAGYGGVSPKLRDSSGNVVASSGWTYTSSGSSGISITANYNNFSGTPAVYSCGSMRCWSGSGYVTVTLDNAPTLSDYTEGNPT